jgi:hypothetical protein
MPVYESVYTGAQIDARLGKIAPALHHAWDSPYSYCGTAPNESADDAEVWTITRIELDAAGDVVSTRTATGVAWDDYLTAEYT